MINLQLYHYLITLHPNLNALVTEKKISVGRLQGECVVFKNVILKLFLKENNPDVCYIYKF